MDTHQAPRVSRRTLTRHRGQTDVHAPLNCSALFCSSARTALTADSLRCKFDDDLVAQNTPAHPRPRSPLSQIHMTLEHVLGPEPVHPAVADTPQKCPTSRTLATAHWLALHHLTRRPRPSLTTCPAPGQTLHE